MRNADPKSSKSWTLPWLSIETIFFGDHDLRTPHEKLWPWRFTHWNLQGLPKVTRFSASTASKVGSPFGCWMPLVNCYRYMTISKITIFFWQIIHTWSIFHSELFVDQKAKKDVFLNANDQLELGRWSQVDTCTVNGFPTRSRSFWSVSWEAWWSWWFWGVDRLTEVQLASKAMGGSLWCR